MVEVGVILSFEGSFDTFNGVAPSPVGCFGMFSWNRKIKCKLILFGKSCYIPLRYCHSLRVTELKSVFDADSRNFSNFHVWGREHVKVWTLWVCYLESKTGDPGSTLSCMDCIVLSRWLNFLICTFLEVNLFLYPQWQKDIEHICSGELVIIFPTAQDCCDGLIIIADIYSCLVHARHLSKHFKSIIYSALYEYSVTTTLHKRRLRHRGLRQLAQGHTASYLRIWLLNWNLQGGFTTL